MDSEQGRRNETTQISSKADIFQAKILRVTHDPDAAIAVLQDGLKSDRPSTFRQADALVCFINIMKAALFMSFLDSLSSNSHGRSCLNAGIRKQLIPSCS